MPHAGSGHSVSSAPAGDLAQLVAVEQEIEQQLVRARAQAAALTQAATREAEDLTRAWQQESETARLRMQASLEQEQGVREAEIIADGRARASWYDELPASTLSELAGAVLDRLLSEDHE